MKYLVLLLALLTSTAYGQNKNKAPVQTSETTSYQAPISCTVNVPVQVCKDATSEFSILQQTSKVMGQVEIVVADEAAFKQEHDRLYAQYQRTVEATAEGKDNAALLSLLNHKPVAPTMLDDSVLFVLEEKGLRNIRKVFVSSDLFRGLNLKEKPTVDKENVLHIARGEYDPTLVSIWSSYIAGYVEGWWWCHFVS